MDVAYIIFLLNCTGLACNSQQNDNGAFHQDIPEVSLPQAT